MVWEMTSACGSPFPRTREEDVSQTRKGTLLRKEQSRTGGSFSAEGACSAAPKTTEARPTGRHHLLFRAPGLSSRDDRSSRNFARATTRLAGIVGLATGLVVSIGIAAPNIAVAQASQTSRSVASAGKVPVPDSGYWLARSNGVVLAFGKATELRPASTGARRIVGIASTPDSRGYWLVSSAGVVFAFGDAAPHGSTGARHLEKPIVGIASSPDGRGYWLVGSNGAVFAFGDAKPHGSLAAGRSAKPIVAIASTPDGRGYWLVASNGSVFTFGDATFHGSARTAHLNGPAVGITSTPTGKGYWLAASDGGVFAFGNAMPYGSMGGRRMAGRVVGITSTPNGKGYWLVASNGGVFAFGNAAFSGSAASASRNIVGIARIGKAFQAITFNAPSTGTYKGSWALLPSASSRLLVTLAVDASTTGNACSLSGTTVKYLNAGNCVLDANQAGNESYLSAPQLTRTIVVGKASQVITFTAPATGSVFGSSALAPSASSGLSVSLGVDASTTGNACTLSGTTVKYLNVGNCVLDANQAGNGNYLSGDQLTRTVVVGKASQVITFAAPATGAVYGSAALKPSASSGLPVSLAVDASTTGNACSLSGATVKYLNVGNCVLDVNQAGNLSYLAAPQLTRTVVVGKASQAITFTVPPTAVYDGSAALAPSAASGLPVSLAVDASTTDNACSLSGTTVKYLNVGNCVLDANQAGNASYLPAPQLTRTIVVGKASQAITFTAPATGAVNGSSALKPSASSGLPVSLAVDASTTHNACSLSGTTLKYLNVGTCVLDANQAGNASYLSAAQLTRTIVVAKAAEATTTTKP